MKIALITLFLFSGLAPAAFAQDSYFLYLSKNIQIDEFKDSSLSSICSSEAKSIYTYSKNLFAHLQSLGSSSCPITVTIIYNDANLRQSSFDKGPKRETSKLIGTLDLYAQNTCTEKYVEATWTINQAGSSCTATTYLQGTHARDQNSQECVLSEYLSDQKDWLEQQLAQTFE